MIRITVADLLDIAPRAVPSIVNGIAGPLNSFLPQGDITTPRRIAHFLGQAAHETDGFRSLHEYASGAAYEGRKDLGNVRPGDGRRYKGRGIFMATGRANYRRYGDLLGVDLEGNPELAADPTISVRLAVAYWGARGLNAWADRDDIREITRRINGGYNGLADRQTYVSRAKRAIDVMPVPPVPLPRPDDPSKPEPEIEPDAPIALEPPKPLVESKTIWSQAMQFVAGGGATLLAYIQSPWAVAALAVLVIAGIIVWRERVKRQQVPV